MDGELFFLLRSSFKKNKLENIYIKGIKGSYHSATTAQTFRPYLKFFLPVIMIFN